MAHQMMQEGDWPRVDTMSALILEGLYFQEFCGIDVNSWKYNCEHLAAKQNLDILDEGFKGQWTGWSQFQQMADCIKNESKEASENWFASKGPQRMTAAADLIGVLNGTKWGNYIYNVFCNHFC